jgi:hypothetical protein
MRVVIVDDSPVVRVVLREGLSRSLALSNRIFLRRGTVPPWAATPTDAPPRVP